MDFEIDRDIAIERDINIGGEDILAFAKQYRACKYDCLY